MERNEVVPTFENGTSPSSAAMIFYAAFSSNTVSTLDVVR
jgi:hypothetical protein